MIARVTRQRVFAYGAPVDMRKGFDGLYSLIKESLEHDPLSGDLYLFVSRNRIRAKVLLWDGTGLCVYAKRLEKGRFAALWACSEGGYVTLSPSELQLFLEGSQWVGKMPLSPPHLAEESLLLGADLM